MQIKVEVKLFIETNKPKKEKTNRLQILGFLPEMASYQTQWIQFWIESPTFLNIFER